jgi:hypothetical protein
VSQRLEGLLRRHRDANSPTLSVDWGLLRLLDRALCDQLATDLRQQGQAWEVQAATEHAWEATPDEAGLYMFVWRPFFAFDVAEQRRPGDLAQVLYVGKAGADDSGGPTEGTLRTRYRDYVKYLRSDPAELWSTTHPSTRPQLLRRYLTLRPLEHWFLIVRQRTEIPVLEDRLIKLLKPPCNRQRLPKLVMGPPTRAF